LEKKVLAAAKADLYLDIIMDAKVVLLDLNSTDDRKVSLALEILQRTRTADATAERMVAELDYSIAAGKMVADAVGGVFKAMGLGT
jgi:hypothetical protein